MSAWSYGQITAMYLRKAFQSDQQTMDVWITGNLPKVRLISLQNGPTAPKQSRQARECGLTACGSLARGSGRR